MLPTGVSGTPDAWLAWYDRPDGPTRVKVDTRHAGPVRYAIAGRAAIFVGGELGMQMIDDGKPTSIDTLLGLASIGPVGATGFSMANVIAVAIDGEENVWTAGRRRGSPWTDGYGSFVAFSTVPDRWHPRGFDWRDHQPVSTVLTGAARPANKEGRQYPVALRWRAPFLSMAGDPRGVGIWVYGLQDDGAPHLTHVGANQASTYPRTDPPSAVPDGIPVPALASPEMAADLEGRVWVAGDTLEGSKAYRFDGNTFADLTPPADLLKGRRFTQILCSKSGDLYAATDGVGVLVYDGTEWRAHEVNPSLPTLEGTELRPVSCIDLDPDLGFLWLGMDENIICWRPDE